MAHCRACRKEIDVAQMGETESALQSHAKGEGHGPPRGLRKRKPKLTVVQELEKKLEKVKLNQLKKA